MNERRADARNRGRPQSGGGMDRVVESQGPVRPGQDRPRRRRPRPPRSPLFYFFAPGANSQTVEAARLTISTVSQGRFDDFLPLRARVEPSLTVFLDAVEGGRVERVLVEDGAMVQQGQLLAVLSNSDLQLNVLARQTEVTQQINSMRSQELALNQTRLANERARIEADLATQTARRNYEMQRPLAERGFVSGRPFADSRDTYEANRRRSDVLRRQQADRRAAAVEPARPAARLGRRAQRRASTSPAPPSTRSTCARRSRASSPPSRSRSASRCSAASGSARSTAPAATSCAPRSTNSISAGSPRARSPTPRSAAAPTGCGSAKSIRRSATARSRSTSSSSAPEPADLQRGQTVQIRLTLGAPTPGAADPERRLLQRDRRQLGVRGRARRPLRGPAPGPPRPPQHRFHRSARRARPRRARHHLSLYRFRRARPADPQVGNEGSRFDAEHA